MKRRGDQIVMVTAYDAPAARLADEAGIDLILVGDSAGKRVLGYGTTLPVTMDEMMVLVGAVCRGARRPLVIADLPFGSYHLSDEQAVSNSIRFVKEAGASAVKLEGAGPMLQRVRAIVDAGISVMGHIGFTPQSAAVLGDMEAQDHTAVQARRLYDDALDLQAAGCFSMVLDIVPSRVAARITETLRIPTIGIGSGPGCDGQLLVWHDLLGMNPGRVPRFVKHYADVAGEMRRGLAGFASEVRSGAYPAEGHSYVIGDAEFRLFDDELSQPSAAD
jgi:3-methyl-2-oxobutanoate hydroxymethyltransferase